MLSILDEEGRLIEEDQRALVRHVVQEGYGADILFSAGTTGEWDKFDNETRQAVIRVCAEEVSKLNLGLVANGGPAVESWAGVTAPTTRDTLANLEFALDSGVDAAVIAPLSMPPRPPSSARRDRRRAVVSPRCEADHAGTGLGN